MTLYDQPEPCGMGNHSWYECPQCSVHWLWVHPESLAEFASMLAADIANDPMVNMHQYGAYGVAIHHWRYKVLDGIREINFKSGHDKSIGKGMQKGYIYRKEN